MIELLSINWLPLLIALVVGVATAWWAWGQRNDDAWADDEWGEDYFSEDTPDADAAARAGGPQVFSPSAAGLGAGAATGNGALGESLTSAEDDGADADAQSTATKANNSAHEEAGTAAKVTPLFTPTGPGTGSGSATIDARDDSDAKPRPMGAAALVVDDLTVLKGVGPKIKEKLARLGVTRFDQIAAWTEDDVARIDEAMEPFRGRIVREKWVDQAQLLAKGDWATFEQRYGD